MSKMEDWKKDYLEMIRKKGFLPKLKDDRKFIVGFAWSIHITKYYKNDKSCLDYITLYSRKHAEFGMKTHRSHKYKDYVEMDKDGNIIFEKGGK